MNIFFFSLYLKYTWIIKVANVNHFHKKINGSQSGPDLGGEGADADPQGFDPLSTQRVPLWYFLRNPFLDDPP